MSAVGGTMNYIRIILVFCLLVMMSQGGLAWASLRANKVPGLEVTESPSHDYILKQAYYNLEADPAFNGSNFPPLEDILQNEGQYASTFGGLTGGSPDVTTPYSFHEYNPATDKGGAPAEAFYYHSSLKQNLMGVDAKKAPKDAAWLAHFIADMSCPSHVNGMPAEDLPDKIPLVLPEEVICYSLPENNSGMGRVGNSLGQKDKEQLISGIPTYAPIRGRGWFDNQANNWVYEYSHFKELAAKDKEG
ncbi:Uncharacterised protein [uncultured archaeon]|nr:Uncharacterised protein [uncultured archaeon]